jgi:hypothetical protein
VASQKNRLVSRLPTRMTGRTWPNSPQQLHRIEGRALAGTVFTTVSLAARASGQQVSTQ